MVQTFGRFGKIVEGQRIHRLLVRRVLQHTLGGVIVAGHQQRAAEQHHRLAAVVGADRPFERGQCLAQRIGTGGCKLQPDSAERDVRVTIIRIVFGGITEGEHRTLWLSRARERETERDFA